MLCHRLLAGTVLFTLFSPFLSTTQAQNVGAPSSQALTRPRRAAVAGMITERLSPKNLQRWKAIERFVFAEDSSGQLQHPTLRGLWEWAESSGHAIYIELSEPGRASNCTAGSFSIEQLDPLGKRHAAVIRLYLSNIDLAYVGPRVTRNVNFTPFEGLSKEERYAEVLGHELSHACFILGDLKRARLVEEVVEQTNEMLLMHTQRTNGPLDQGLRQRLLERDSLLQELEAQADQMEAAVWREILTSKKAPDKNSLLGKK